MNTSELIRTIKDNDKLLIRAQEALERAQIEVARLNKIQSRLNNDLSVIIECTIGDFGIRGRNAYACGGQVEMHKGTLKVIVTSPEPLRISEEVLAQLRQNDALLIQLAE